MRPLFLLLLLISLILSACKGGEFQSGSPTQPLPLIVQSETEASYNPTVTISPTALPPTPSPTSPPPTPSLTPEIDSPFAIKPGTLLPPQGPLISFQAGSAPNHLLFLADPTEGISYQFNFPTEAHFSTPFLAGLSPNAENFVYFLGGQLENLYGVEHLRLHTPDLTIKVVDLQSSEIIFSAHLLSPSFPKDLLQIAETIKDEWHFTSQNASLEDVQASTQELLLDSIRGVAWSPDSTLLGFVSQDPGPSSDLYFFSPESRTARKVTTDPAHILRTSWAPDSASLILITSLFDRHAREDTTYLLSRDGSVLTSLTSQISFFKRWHDSNYAIFYGGTDAGDYFDLTAISAADGYTSRLWTGSFADIALSPDLSSLLLSSDIPTAPLPPGSGLYLGKSGETSLMTLSNSLGWRVTYWGSPKFSFAASSIEEGTIGITVDGERLLLDSGVWKLTPAPDGNFLAGYMEQRPSTMPGLVPGLRIFDGTGHLLRSTELVDVTCVGWKEDASILAYQVESSLYIWEAESDMIRLVSNQLNPHECSFAWIREAQ